MTEILESPGVLLAASYLVYLVLSAMFVGTLFCRALRLQDREASAELDREVQELLARAR